MKPSTPGHTRPSTVGQRAKYDELNEDLLYSSPHCEHTVVPPDAGIDGRPATPFDESVTTDDGQELVPGTYARERRAQQDAKYRAAAEQYETETETELEDNQSAAVEGSSDAGGDRGGRPRAAGTYADVRAATVGQPIAAVVDADVGAVVRSASTGAYWEQTLAEVGEPRPAVDDQAPFATTDPARYMLATAERLRGEHAEQDRHRSKARAAAALGVDRAARCRTAVAEETPYEKRRPGYIETVPQTYIPSERSPLELDVPADPRPSFDQATLGQVNRAAARLAEHFGHETQLGRASFSRHVARQVAAGQSVIEAAVAVRESVERFPGVRQDLADIDPYRQHETTVEVDVVTLWIPKHRKQYQVGLVTDGTCEPVKFTIWHAAGDKPTIREGDTLRVERAKVNTYRGDPTLAVAGDTELRRLERGEGPATARRRRSWDDATLTPWAPDSDPHAWINRVDMDRAIEVTLDRE